MIFLILLFFVFCNCRKYLKYKNYLYYRSNFTEVLQKELEWFPKCVRGSGAVAAQDELKWIVPYYSHLGVIGMMEHPDFNMNITKNWIQWYSDHINTSPDIDGLTGTIYDYNVTNGMETPKYKYDSVDSYAALYFSVIRKYVEKNPGQETINFVKTFEKNISRVLKAIDAVMESDHLTWAKFTYHAKYLMDNSEVAWGLRDLAWIYKNVFSNTSMFEKYDNMRKQVENSIEQYLWLNETQCYGVAKFSSGKTGACDFNKWYPYTYLQVWPVYTGILSHESERAKMLYNKVVNVNYDFIKSPRNEPDCVFGLVAAIMKRKEALDKWNYIMEEYVRYGKTSEHKYPYMTSTCGQFIQMNQYLIKMYDEGWNVCFGKESIMDDVCSGNGQCVDYDTCDCKGDYIGDQCEKPADTSGFLVLNSSIKLVKIIFCLYFALLF